MWNVESESTEVKDFRPSPAHCTSLCAHQMPRIAIAAYRVSSECAAGSRSVARLSLQVRPDPPDEFGGSYESECRPGGPYGALTSRVRSDPPGWVARLSERMLARPWLDVAPRVRSDPLNEFSGSYQSECAAGGRYGALKLTQPGSAATATPGPRPPTRGSSPGADNANTRRVRVPSGRPSQRTPGYR